MRGPDGKWGVWPLEGGGIHLIPGLESTFSVAGWSPDGGSVYAVSGRPGEKTQKLYQVNIVTGKMELWRTFGADVSAGVTDVGAVLFSRDASAYAYIYERVLSEAYVVTGLR